MKAYFSLIFAIFLPHLCHPTKPDILFIIVDDLRPALGIYGDPNAHTPHIDNLALKSFVFTNAFAQQALCAPSRNSLLTSRRPDSLRLYDFSSYWRNTIGNFTSLPQHFRDNGYFTHSIGKVFHPGASSNFNDDALYSWSMKPFHPKTDVYKDSKTCITKTGELAKNLICPVIPKSQPGGTLPDLESLQEARKFVLNKKNITGGKPYFLAVGFHKPHVPFKFPIKYLRYHPLQNISLPRNRWRPSSMPAVAWNPWLDVKSRDDISKLNVLFPFGNMPDNITQQIIQAYNAATTYIDDLIGQLLAKVDLQKTIVVLTSDHGWSRGEHGEFAKYSNFDVATKVPLIIHVPFMHPYKIGIDKLAELVDVFPTLVDLTQISPSMEKCSQNQTNLKLCTEGTSLLSAMSINESGIFPSEKKAIFTQYPRPGPFPTQKPNSDRPKLNEINVMGYSIRTKRYRYTEWIKFNNTNFTPDWMVSYGKELYDHMIDPEENLNLVLRPQLDFVTNVLQKQLILGWRYA